jgi:hypothetical protein
MMRASILAVAALSLSASGVFAQGTRADSLLRAGAWMRAESLYYAAARARPRDPAARMGLGRYLAARGATRVAVTLFEEALQFGGDAPTIAAELAPLYLALGEYQALAALPAASLSSAERARAKWLEEHPTRLIAPDSVMTVGYRESTDGYVGRMPIRINGRTVDAAIDVRALGVTVSDSFATATRIRRFPTAPARGARVANVPAAADSLAIGRLAWTNMPVRIDTLSVPVVLGFDVLARLAPTFDPRGDRVTLRIGGARRPISPPGATALTTLIQRSDIVVSQAGGWLSLRSPAIARLLAEHRWTFDNRRGQLIVEP